MRTEVRRTADRVAPRSAPDRATVPHELVLDSAGRMRQHPVTRMQGILRCIRFVVTAAAAGALLSGRSDERPVRLRGSDLVGPAVEAALKAAATATGREVDVALAGSREARRALDNGTADAGLVLLRPGEEWPAHVRAVPVAFFAGWVSVAKTCPVEELTLPQLAAVFGSEAPASYTRWGELGAAGEWSDRPITARALAPKVDLSLQLFRQMVLGGRELKPEVRLAESLEELWRDAAREPGALVLSGAPPPASAGMKVVLVADRRDGVAFGPTPENLRAGDYPLGLTLWLAVRPDGVARDLLVWHSVLGEEVAEAFATGGWVPVPRSVREQAKLEWER